MSIPRPAPRKTRKAPARRLLTLAPFVLVAIGAAVLGAVSRKPQGQVAPGVRVGELPLDGKTLEEARAALEKWATKQQTVTLTLRCAPETGLTRVWKPNASKLGLGIDIPNTLKNVSRIEPTGLREQVSQWLSGAKTNAPVPPTCTLEPTRLRTYLKTIAAAVNRSAKNARFTLMARGGYAYGKEKTGLELDQEAAVKAIVSAWVSYLSAPPVAAAPPENKQTGGTETPSPGQQPQDKAPQETPPAAERIGNALDVTLPMKVTQPKLTLADVKQIDGSQPMGQYTTHFGGTGRSRGSNIALAASHINGTLLAPGDVFSYNRVVGPRVASAGFQDAPVIVHGELVPGIGGGICQVSSTLYNAVLLSDLKIVRRSHHAFPVHYLPPGRDATVVDGAIDFQFQNSTPAPLYIAASASHGRLTFRVFGKRVPGRTVHLELADHEVTPAPTETERDATLPAGKRVVKDKGHRGHRVTVFRVVTDNGQVVKRERLYRDHYRPFPAVVLVGTRPKAPKPARSTPSPPATAPANPAPQPPAPSGTVPGQ